MASVRQVDLDLERMQIVHNPPAPSPLPSFALAHDLINTATYSSGLSPGALQGRWELSRG